jgi:hypothetical protein|tara:strand:+ start:19 stop:597 length:579 start_codon:yes stop_codon:yes gene_type:complete
MLNKPNRKVTDARPPKEQRVLSRGDTREDGMIFWRYDRHCIKGENWITKEAFDKRFTESQEHLKKMRSRNPSWNNEYMKEYRKVPENKLVINQRKRISQALRGILKSNHTLDLLGCSAFELKAHLESKFQDGMSWDNYGRDGWHCDHIRPCASFDLSDPKQQEECFHYSNLQPLWAKDNLSKKDKYKPPTEE